MLRILMLAARLVGVLRRRSRPSVPLAYPPQPTEVAVPQFEDDMV